MDNTHKYFEIRDRMTFIPVLAVPLTPRDSRAEEYLLGMVGFKDTKHVALIRLDSMMSGYDTHQWAGRTLTTAHQHISDNWDELSTGDVIDVEYILGETHEPKTPQRLEEY